MASVSQMLLWLPSASGEQGRADSAALAPRGSGTNGYGLGIEPILTDAAGLQPHSGNDHRGIGGNVRRHALGMIPGLRLAGPLSDLRGRRKVVYPPRPSLCRHRCPHSRSTRRRASVPRTLSRRGLGGRGLCRGERMAARALPPTVWQFQRARRGAISITAGFGFGPLVAGLLAQWAPAATVVPYPVWMAGLLTAMGTVLETVPANRRRAFGLAVPGFCNRCFVGPMAP